MNESECKTSESVGDLKEYLVMMGLVPQNANLFVRGLALLLDLFLVFLIFYVISTKFVIPRFSGYQEILTQLVECLKNTESNKAIILKNLIEKNPQAGDLIQSIQLVMCFVCFLYFFVNEWLLKGCTLGKQIFQLKVIKLGNRMHLSISDIFFRNLIKSCSLISFFPLFFISVTFVFFTVRRQSCHDILCQTMVVDDPSRKRKNFIRKNLKRTNI